MEIIQDIGSYAGFAAVVGLAVLSALYFSQARDVRRLREWAGRAPERTAQLEAEAAARATAAARPSAVQARPQPKPAQAQAAGPKAPPVAGPAQAAAAGAAPAVAQGPAAAPAKDAQQGGGDAKDAAAGEGEGEQAVTPGPQVPATVGSSATEKEAEKEAVAKPGPAAPSAPKVPAVPSRGPGPATAAAGGPGAPRPAANGGSAGAPPKLPARAGNGPRTGVLPASAAARDPWYRRIHWPAPRYVALLLAGVVIVGGGAAYGVGQILSEDEPATTQAPADDGDEPPPEDGDGGGTAAPQPVNRSTVTVSVLNGTTVGGLAAQIADKVGQEGFQVGNIDNALDQAKAESAVLYAAGARQEGREVARVLGISQTEQVDPETQSRAGNASVVVIVGADQTR
ncbi:MAG TPA: LytR C-terminal domain-containing protein [Thermoleophilaceae bacterium]|nr:LytR C-terminal domain-containing protein [Thermoleophilaceae bacterium]